MPAKDESLRRAAKPVEDAIRLHTLSRGKLQMIPKCAIRDLRDFAIWYTPGVAAPCEQGDPAPRTTQRRRAAG
jgi:malate dehydrogenase (oxaloacetate-decarboxylating)